LQVEDEQAGGDRRSDRKNRNNYVSGLHEASCANSLQALPCQVDHWYVRQRTDDTSPGRVTMGENLPDRPIHARVPRNFANARTVQVRAIKQAAP